MLKTNSHQSNTHIQRLSLSASVVIIIITRLHATSRIITQFSIISCCTILPPVHSKSMSRHQLSNYSINELEHSETDMNA